jgi:hypothetical protein
MINIGHGDGNRRPEGFRHVAVVEHYSLRRSAMVRIRRRGTRGCNEHFCVFYKSSLIKIKNKKKKKKKKKRNIRNKRERTYPTINDCERHRFIIIFNSFDFLRIKRYRCTAEATTRPRTQRIKQSIFKP